MNSTCLSCSQQSLCIYFAFNVTPDLTESKHRKQSEVSDASSAIMDLCTKVKIAVVWQSNSCSIEHDSAAHWNIFN